MSRGIGVNARLVEQSDEWLIYRYGPFNWNTIESRNPDYEMDGSIRIKIEVLPTIEYHNRNSKKSGKAKGQIKQVIHKYTSEEMIARKLLVVENSKYSWNEQDETGIDLMALRAVWKLIGEYEQTGEIPDKISILS